MKNEDLLNSTIQEIFTFIGVKPSVTITVQEENIFNIDIQGNNLNYLIGYKGESLNALQSLLNLITFKRSGKPSIITVDINNYKGKKTERIIEITKTFIDKVRFFEKEIIMPPMNPWER
jgi:spoIIIJ-associated protein